MPKLALGTNFTIFLLFFGISLLDTWHSRDWARAVLWLAIGLFFLRADSLKGGPSDRTTDGKSS